MHPSEERVINEKRELEEKLVRLGDFILTNSIFKKLEAEDQELLCVQRHIMM